jgi:hypothetical protein
MVLHDIHRGDETGFVIREGKMPISVVQVPIRKQTISREDGKGKMKLK